MSEMGIEILAYDHSNLNIYLTVLDRNGMIPPHTTSNGKFELRITENKNTKSTKPNQPQDSTPHQANQANQANQINPINPINQIIQNHQDLQTHQEPDKEDPTALEKTEEKTHRQTIMDDFFKEMDEQEDEPSNTRIDLTIGDKNELAEAQEQKPIEEVEEVEVEEVEEIEKVEEVEEPIIEIEEIEEIEEPMIEKEDIENFSQQIILLETPANSQIDLIKEESPVKEIINKSNDEYNKSMEKPPTKIKRLATLKSTGIIPTNNGKVINFNNPTPPKLPQNHCCPQRKKIITTEEKVKEFNLKLQSKQK
ncbi:hypothetical protein DICPUDRAFT_146922 [Dictyostelium purpureum]|uniref:Uncharacterized protein n=1 Tax=Dictyostelium purpureum TaxID=5786 RepID=F0Z787_DICPU|nr:uncharacterized protein DICPUDRAFT_146922 [Dictyostelium purpureum]EGC40201.1 hypothetical protein DICPUDRAFT_146922 [Dictyostelium purpureum]|eukprot:XP_003283270.1 hypothetical protein DICPUDRAFT_146922 [Dictyostelium purpureum]